MSNVYIIILLQTKAYTLTLFNQTVFLWKAVNTGIMPVVLKAGEEAAHL